LQEYRGSSFTQKCKRGSKILQNVPDNHLASRVIRSPASSSAAQTQREVCCVCGEWNYPDAEEDEIEDEWTGCDSCMVVHWHHKGCCDNFEDPCGVNK